MRALISLYPRQCLTWSCLKFLMSNVVDNHVHYTYLHRLVRVSHCLFRLTVVGPCLPVTVPQSLAHSKYSISWDLMHEPINENCSRSLFIHYDLQPECSPKGWQSSSPAALFWRQEDTRDLHRGPMPWLPIISLQPPRDGPGLTSTGLRGVSGNAGDRPPRVGQNIVLEWDPRT